MGLLPSKRAKPSGWRWTWGRLLYVGVGAFIILMLSLSAFASTFMRDEPGEVVFVDIADSVLADASARAEGACWGDIDGDRDQDLFVANGSGASRLWRNEGKGRFTDVTEAARVVGLRRATGCALIDVDNDGDLDLYVSSKNNKEKPTPENKLFRNRGDGTFVDVTAAAGVAMANVGSASSDWADYDGDGDYDAFVAARWRSLVRYSRLNAFFKQTDPVTFENIARATGLDNPIGPQHAFLGSWFDYDSDGDVDLLLAIDFWGIELFRNDKGKFTRVTTKAFPPATDDTPGAAPNNAMGATWGDVDNDGCFDVFITGMNLYGTTGGFGSDILGDLASRLYRSNCDGTFADVTIETGLHPTGVLEWSTNFIDFDNDGDLDLSVVGGNAAMSSPAPEQKKWKPYARRLRTLIVTQARRGILAVLPNAARLSEWAYRFEMMIPASGAMGIAAAMPNYLYQNMLVESGKLAFVIVNQKLNPRDLGATLGSAWADMDNDGDLDWFVPNRGTPSRLYRNDGPVGNHLRVHLVGAPLRDAVGAHVRVKAGGRVLSRHVHILDGYLSQSQMDPHFGLGRAGTIDEVWVRWAGSATWQLRCRAVPANQTITITQGTAGCR